jgi:hypothetical protein
MKNNDNPALLAHKRQVDADRRALAVNKARARQAARRNATVAAMERMVNAPKRVTS